MFSLRRWYRAARYGPPIVVVSGLPRSGTSMMMRMLDAGGLPIATDGVRTADSSNPHGYFEHERVKDLDKTGDKSWLIEVRGRAIKIISFLLPELPATHNYDVIFMRRDIAEVLASQDAMLASRAADESPQASPERLAAGFRLHLSDMQRLLSSRPEFRVVYVEHGNVLQQPLDQARAIARFLGRPLDTTAMAAAVDPQLHRQRRS